MIAKQKIHTGNNFMGAYDYNDQKMKHKDFQQRAELLDHNFSKYDRNTVAREVSLLQRLRPNLTRDTYHVSLNFGIEDKLTNSQLISIAEDYRKGMGFDDNLYSLWQHHDADHCHAHLLLFRTRFDGSLVSDSNNYKRSEALCRQIELKYDLQVVKASREATERAPNKDEIEMIQRTGQLSNRMLIQEKVKKSLAESVSVQSFIKNCKENGIHLLFNQSGSTGRVSGITYLADNGFMARGQALGNMFKWKNIAEKINHEQSRDFEAIREGNGRTRDRFKTILERNSRDGNRSEERSENNLGHPRRTIQNNHRSNGYEGNSESAGFDTKENSRSGNADKEVSQNTNADLFHPMHSASSSLFSATGGAPDSEIDDEQKRKKRRGR